MENNHTTHQASMNNQFPVEIACVKSKEGVTLMSKSVLKNGKEKNFTDSLYFTNKDAQALAMSILTQGAILDAKEEVKNTLFDALNTGTNLCDEIADFIALLDRKS